MCLSYESVSTCLSVCLSVRCRDWLLVHLVLLSSTELLREMPLSLLEELLASPDLFVMQVEMDIYTMLKKVRCVLRNNLRGAPGSGAGGGGALGSGAWGGGALGSGAWGGGALGSGALGGGALGRWGIGWGVHWEGGGIGWGISGNGRVRVLFVLNVICCDSIDSGCFSI